MAVRRFAAVPGILLVAEDKRVASEHKRVLDAEILPSHHLVPYIPDMTAAIFMVHGDQLVEMTETAYDSEAVLQELLAAHPRLLAGDSTAGSPQRWMLVKREAALAHESGSSSWSVDHVFLDQNAVPTIVEVKRSSNTEIRRSVVGQMLDYAANAIVYWPAEHLRVMFEATCEGDGVDPEGRLSELLGPDVQAEDFWNMVQTNLQAQRVRLVFVADTIPAELRRIIEFLNVQMSPAEVIGVEVKQYIGASAKTLVPRVVGQTAEAQQRKSASAVSPTTWTWELYASELNVPASRIEVGRALVEKISAAAPNLKVNMVKGYISFLRLGGYKVAAVDLIYKRTPRFAVKLPEAPASLGLANPYTNLQDDWWEQEHEWGWQITSLGAIPDVGVALSAARPYHPSNGPMAIPGEQLEE